MIQRKIDDLGRVTIPKSFARELGWEPGDAVMASKVGDSVVYRKFTQCCCICGFDHTTYVDLNGKKICGYCVEAIKSV